MKKRITIYLTPESEDKLNVVIIESLKNRQKISKTDIINQALFEFKKQK